MYPCISHIDTMADMMGQIINFSTENNSNLIHAVPIGTIGN